MPLLAIVLRLISGRLVGYDHPVAIHPRIAAAQEGVDLGPYRDAMWTRRVAIARRAVVIVQNRMRFGAVGGTGVTQPARAASRAIISRPSSSMSAISLTARRSRSSAVTIPR